MLDEEQQQKRRDSMNVLPIDREATSVRGASDSMDARARGGRQATNHTNERERGEVRHREREHERERRLCGWLVPKAAGRLLLRRPQSWEDGKSDLVGVKFAWRSRMRMRIIAATYLIKNSDNLDVGSLNAQNMMKTMATTCVQTAYFHQPPLSC